MSDSLRPQGLRHTRLLRPSSFPGVYSNSWPLSHDAIPLLLLPSVFPSIRIFSNESAVCSRWPKYYSFSISPSSEYSGLISFIAPCCPKDSQESSPAPQFESIDSLVLNFLYGLTITCVHDYGKNHNFDYTDLCQQSNVLDQVSVRQNAKDWHVDSHWECEFSQPENWSRILIKVYENKKTNRLWS